MTLEESVHVLDLLISTVSSSLIIIYGTASIFKIVKMFLTF